MSHFKSSLNLILLLSILWISNQSQSKPCDHKWCNYEGICSESNGNKSCDCLTWYYTGDKCNIKTDHCKSNPCGTNGKCNQYPGGYVCDCIGDFIGQNCSQHRTTDILFTNAYIHYNHIGPVNTDQWIILFFKDLGNVAVEIQLTGESYAIDSFPINVDKFKYTSNLKIIADQLNIRKSEFLNNFKGYYVTERVQVVLSGRSFFKLLLTESKTYIELSLWEFEYHAYIEPGNCNPKVTYKDCGHHQRNLKRLLIDRTNFIHPVFDPVDGCISNRTDISVEWTISDYLDRSWVYISLDDSFKIPFYQFLDIFRRYSNKKSIFRLTIPPYHLQNENSTDLFYMFSVAKCKVTLTDTVTNRLIGVTFARCYIQMIMVLPIAIIDGGPRREESFKSNLIEFDGRKSRDMSVSVRQKNQLGYNWSCNSTTSTPFCNSSMGTGPQLQIPGHTLQLNQKLNIYLEVYAYSTDWQASTYQELTVIDEIPLHVKIKCVKNCGPKSVNNQQYSHLQAKSIESNIASYKWTIQKELPLNSEIIVIQDSNSSRLLLGKNYLQDGSNYIIQVQITNDLKRIGSSQIVLNGNSRPSSAKCSIEPNSGIAFQMEFKIACKNTVKKDYLKYVLYENDHVVNFVENSDTFTSRLSKDRAKLTVKIEDQYKTSIIVPVPSVQILPLLPVNSANRSAEIFKLIDGGNITLKELIKIQDLTSSLALTNALSNELSASNQSDKSEAIEQIVDLLYKIDLTSMEDIDLITGSLGQLIQIVPLSHKLSQKVSQIVDKISSSLLSICKQSDDQSVEATDRTVQNLLRICDAIIEPVDKVPNAQDYDSLLPSDGIIVEDYPDYGDLDSIMDMVTNLDYATHSVRNTFDNLAETMNLLMEPKEESFRAGTKLSTINSIIVDRENVTRIQFGMDKINETEVLLSPDFLRGTLRRDLSVTYTNFQRNPYWWFPETFPECRRVFMLSISDKRDVYQPDFRESISKCRARPFRSLWNFWQNKTVGCDDRLTLNETTGYVLAEYDMVNYRFQSIEVNSLLIVNFTLIERNLATETGQLKIVFKCGSRPKFHNTLHSKEYQVISEPSVVLYRHDCKRSKNDQIYMSIFMIESTSNQLEINFKLEATVVLCQAWDNDLRSWNDQVCQVGWKSDDHQVNCQCKYCRQIDMFSGKMYRPSVRLELPRNYRFQYDGNYFMIYFLIIFLLIYGGILIWTQHMDRCDRELNRIIPLAESCPAGIFKYLIEVITGDHKYSGTSSNIRLKIIGMDLTTDYYCLTDDNRTVPIFNPSCTRSFLLETNYDLKVIQSIHLDSDYSGNYPSWLCDHIRITDHQRRETIDFNVKQWLSLTMGDQKRLELIVNRSTTTEFNKGKFYDQFKRNHIWLSIFSPSKSSLDRSTTNPNRSQKWTIYCVQIFLAILIVTLFFDRTTDDNYEAEQEEFKKFSIASNRVALSIVVSLIVSTCFSQVFLILYKLN